MKLIPIPKDKYKKYRLDVIFDGYKWDHHFWGKNTISKYILIISEDEHKELVKLTQLLDRETITAEAELNNNLKAAKKLGIPKKIFKELKRAKNYNKEKHVRLTRYDFHPITQGGWAISEINSDVPGGFSEASCMPKLAHKALQNNEDYYYIDFGEILVQAISKKIKENGRIFFAHCTSYSDDRQVMQFLGDKLKALGYETIYGAVNHIIFENKEAICILEGCAGKVDMIVRFTPLEWFKDIKPKCWKGYFDIITASCNHPAAIYAQSKRFPLVWDELLKKNIELPTWNKLLPKTYDVKDRNKHENFLYKPVWGRVGENISIKEACVKNEYKDILKAVRKHPENFIAQKRFDSAPLIAENNEKYHLCLGCFAVEGKAAGYYARMSKIPRIDSFAEEVPVLVEK